MLARNEFVINLFVFYGSEAEVFHEFCISVISNVAGKLWVIPQSPFPDFLVQPSKVRLSVNKTCNTRTTSISSYDNDNNNNNNNNNIDFNSRSFSFDKSILHEGLEQKKTINIL